MVTKVSKSLIYSVLLELENYFSKSFWPVLEVLLLLLLYKAFQENKHFFSYLFYT